MASGWMRVKQRAKQRGVELPLVISDRFLLSAVARTLSLRSIYAEGEQVAYRRFCALRWPETNGRPVCPACACLDVYGLLTRQRFKCAACHCQFSVTSGTIFASRKLSFVDLLAAICLIANASESLSAVQLDRDLDVQQKTAFALMHKLREAIAAETHDAMLSGGYACYLTGIPRITGFRVPTICRSAALGKPARARTGPVGRIDPPHEARAPSWGRVRWFSVAHGHTSAVGLPSIVARDAHAGSGGDRGRRSAISRRISANSVLATATSAIWKAT